MGRANYDRAQYGRSSILRPKYSRAAYRTPEDSPITITAAVLTFTSYWERLTLTLSAAPGDATWVGASGMSWVGAATTWSPGDIADADCVLVGTTLTITTYSNAFGSITNYSPSQDLFQYDGSDSTNLPNVAAVTNLPVTFTGGPLAVPSGAWTIQGDFSSDAGQVDGSFSIAVATWEEDGDAGCTGTTGSNNMNFNSNPAHVAITGTTFAATFINNGSVNVAVAALNYTGINTNFLDGSGRPIPPFLKALSAP